MSGGLLQYSGLVTKTKAMHGKLLSEEELHYLSELEQVEDFIIFLRESKGYADIYESHEEIHHRAQVEAVLHDALYADYGKLYQFANGDQRSCLEIFFLRYEINVLKSCFESAIRGNMEQNLSYLNYFFDKHSSYDTELLVHTQNIQEFVMALDGTPYEALFHRMQNNETMDYGDWMFQLDIYYYKTAWRLKDRIKDARAKQILTQILGTEIDWLNMMWIYRGRQFFRMKVADMQANTIPIYYRIRRETIQRLTETATDEEFLDIVRKTAYITEKDAILRMNDEITFQKVMDRTYGKLVKKYPQSIAPILKYLYDKEHEIDLLTMILEGVRYQIPSREIWEMILPA